MATNKHALQSQGLWVRAITLVATAVAMACPLAASADEASAKPALDGPSFNAEEKRNVTTLSAVLASKDGFERPSAKHFCSTYKNTDADPYGTLNKASGKADGFKVGSISNLKREITDLLVEDNRLWVHILTTGQHSGALFGVAATGKPLSWNEEIYVTFDDAGKICETTRFPVQGELYQQLGGKFTFPYQQYWKCDGCPNNPGVARLEIPGETR